MCGIFLTFPRKYSLTFHWYHLEKIAQHSINPCPAEPGYTLFCKQCRSRSVGFWRSQLIWICTVCHQECKFVAAIWIKQSDWLKIKSGHGISIYSAGQGLNFILLTFLRKYSLIFYFYHLEKIAQHSVKLHSLPFADSRRAVVSFWQKNLHKYCLTA